MTTGDPATAKARSKKEWMPKAPLNIGLTDPAVAPYLPVCTLRNVKTQDTVETTDPGRAMQTGKWADIGKFKGPVLRALAARPAYFHNGCAATLEDVIDFYELRKSRISRRFSERCDSSTSRVYRYSGRGLPIRGTIPPKQHQ
jgi:hypothetical protein